MEIDTLEASLFDVDQILIYKSSLSDRSRLGAEKANRSLASRNELQSGNVCNVF